jgi:hypothetical protein
LLHSYVLPPTNRIQTSDTRSRFEGLADAIRRKSLTPRPEAVEAYVTVFRALLGDDMPALAALVRAYLQLLAPQEPEEPEQDPETQG